MDIYKLIVGWNGDAKGQEHPVYKVLMIKEKNDALKYNRIRTSPNDTIQAMKKQATNMHVCLSSLVSRIYKEFL